MPINFKPMLADNADLDNLKFPVMASPKLDGVRATFVQGELLTRSLKPIPNRLVRATFKCSHMLDGELIVGDPASKSVFRDTMKVVMSHDADSKELRFFVFDLVDTAVFKDRLEKAHEMAEDLGQLYVPVPHVLVPDLNELLRLEELCLGQGYEGLMIRDIVGKYKFGRSTAREGALLKLKRHLTSEAEVIGFQEQMHNANEAKVDNLGYAERSSHQANMVPTGVLGALLVRDIHSGVEFNIGTGFDAATRDEIWRGRPVFLGRICSYEFLPVGVKDKPRHPVWAGWRSIEDIS